MKKGKILFLDFDGVLCDSSRETARTAWLSGTEIWETWKGLDIPKSHLLKFVKLRPVLETGFEAIALIKAINEGYSESFLKENFPFMMQQIFTSISMNRMKLIKLFGKVREDWARLNLSGWLAWHSFYDCSQDIIDAGYESFRSVYIVTTKEKRFAQALLNFSGLPFSPDALYGLEAGNSKASVIAAILEMEGLTAESAVIVEDRVKTITDFSESPSLEGASLYLASWGYVFPEDVEKLINAGSPASVLYPEDAAEQLSRAASV